MSDDKDQANIARLCIKYGVEADKLVDAIAAEAVVRFAAVLDALEQL